MKEQNEKQAIEEMVEISRHVCEGECFINEDGLIDCDVCRSLHFYGNGYRKQSEGKWISCKNGSGYKCSECGSRIKNSAFSHGNHIFCHKCGARMKGGE